MATVTSYIKTEIDSLLGAKVDASEKGVASGVATLGADGKVPAAQIPNVALSDFLGAVASQAEMLALVGQRGDWATRTDLGADFVLIADDPTLLASWRQLTGGGGTASPASETVAGIVELATTAEATTGTDTTRAVTPAGVKAAVDAAGTGASDTAYIRRAIWDGTNYVVNGVTVTNSNRVATTFYSFLGGPDPNALGLMIDGDEWKDAS